VLVGDAGCTNDPASAHGITAALRDAELAAMAIDAGIRDPAAAGEALQAFETARDRSLPLYDLGWAMASYAWDGAAMLEHLSRFAGALVREAQETAAMPPWPGSHHAPPPHV
jgi:flavin-dependent dehydrogenase